MDELKARLQISVAQLCQLMCVSSVILFSACASNEPRSALSQLIDDACAADIILLGENGDHGDGATLAFKMDALEKLVENCGVDLIAFEASFYDFEALSKKQRAGEAISQADLTAALTYIHTRNEEVRKGLPFLVGAYNDGRVDLIGLDYQISARGADYSLNAMSRDLTAGLDTPLRARCQSMLSARLKWDFPPGRPYDAAFRNALIQCLDDMETALDADDIFGDEHGAMIWNLRQILSREKTDRSLWGADRDRVMFENFARAWHKTSPKRAVIWSTNTHNTERPSAESIYSKNPNLGMRVGSIESVSVLNVGFATASGATQDIARKIRELDPVPKGRIEYGHFSPDDQSDAVYLDKASLQAAGPVQGAIYRHRVSTQDWSEAFDALVIIREERPANP